MTINRIRVAVSVAALLMSVHLCLAGDARRQAAEGWWFTWGEKAKAELKGLPEPGRRAFREALIACSLYADELARFMPMSMTAMLTGANAKER